MMYLHRGVMMRMGEKIQDRESFFTVLFQIFSRFYIEKTSLVLADFSDFHTTDGVFGVVGVAWCRVNSQCYTTENP